MCSHGQRVCSLRLNDYFSVASYLMTFCSMENPGQSDYIKKREKMKRMGREEENCSSSSVPQKERKRWVWALRHGCVNWFRLGLIWLLMSLGSVRPNKCSNLNHQGYRLPFSLTSDPNIPQQLIKLKHFDLSWQISMYSSEAHEENPFRLKVIVLLNFVCTVHNTLHSMLNYLHKISTFIFYALEVVKFWHDFKLLRKHEVNIQFGALVYVMRK